MERHQRVYAKQPKAKTPNLTPKEEGMLGSRPFVVQQKPLSGQQADLKTSLAQANKYGHNPNQIQQQNVSNVISIQPKTQESAPSMVIQPKFKLPWGKTKTTTHTPNPQQDLDKIQNLSQDPKVPEHLRNILGEVHGMSQTNLGGQLPNATGGLANAGRIFDANGNLERQDVNYQGETPNEAERIANLVHELTHVSVQNSFGRDYVNYTNDGSRDPDAPNFSNGRMINEGARQNAQKNSQADNALQVKLEDLQRAAINDKKLSNKQKSQVRDKLTYGIQNPHLEFDTVINQISVWLHYWGIKADNSDFAEQLTQVATQNYNERRDGNRVVAATNRRPTFAPATWVPPKSKNPFKKVFRSS